MGGGKQMKWIFRVSLLIFFLSSITINRSFSQTYRYLIENQKLKSRKRPFSYFVKTSIKNFEEFREREKEKKHEKKVLKKVRKRAYSVQTKKTKKRIKQSKKKSEKYNKGKKPFYIKLKKILKNG